MPKRLEEKYEIGCHDGWEFAHDIISAEPGCYTAKELHEIFETNSPRQILDNYSFDQADEKVKAYEKKKEEEAQKPVRGYIYKIVMVGCEEEFDGIFVNESECGTYRFILEDYLYPQSISKESIKSMTKTIAYVDLD